ncbi:MAG TPA: RpiB/LacA/LacB family sugar-phosphate isomerase [Patescibacteria group bacterium]
MKIFLGADHGGYELKEKVKTWLTEWGYEYEDLGAHHLDPADDYPEFSFKVAEKVAQNSDSLGLLLCRSGGGVTIAANKVKGIRAVPVASEKEAEHARAHNNANVVSLAGDWLTDDDAQQIVKTFLDTPYTHEERHQRRLDQISKYERENT